jgi:hypothetical protein
LIWAAQHGLLPGWLDRGVAVVERQAHLGGTLGRFGIHPSLGGSTSNALKHPAYRAPAPARRSAARGMARYRCLSAAGLVDRFMRRIIALASMLAESTASSFVCIRCAPCGCAPTAR